MIIVGVFVILNAAVALIMRSSLVIGTPMQRRDWTLQAFLLANITSGLMAAYFPSIGWLQKAEWHKRTGGLVPAAQPKALAPREWFKLISVLLILSVPFAAWAIAVCLFLKWLTPLLWPGQRPHILLISAVIGRLCSSGSCG